MTQKHLSERDQHKYKIENILYLYQVTLRTKSEDKVKVWILFVFKMVRSFHVYTHTKPCSHEPSMSEKCRRRYLSNKKTSCLKSDKAFLSLDKKRYCVISLSWVKTTYSSKLTKLFCHHLAYSSSNCLQLKTIKTSWYIYQTFLPHNFQVS